MRVSPWRGSHARGKRRPTRRPMLSAGRGWQHSASLWRRTANRCNAGLQPFAGKHYQTRKPDEYLTHRHPARWRIAAGGIVAGRLRGHVSTARTAAAGRAWAAPWPPRPPRAAARSRLPGGDSGMQGRTGPGRSRPAAARGARVDGGVLEGGGHRASAASTRALSRGFLLPLAGEGGEYTQFTTRSPLAEPNCGMLP